MSFLRELAKWLAALWRLLREALWGVKGDSRPPRVTTMQARWTLLQPVKRADIGVNEMVVTDEPVITIAGGLPPGRYRFQLVVEDDAGEKSVPVQALVTVREAVTTMPTNPTRTVEGGPRTRLPTPPVVRRPPVG